VVKVKICGLTNLEDARVAVEAGADLLGFIFYEPSPRYVHPELVRNIITILRDEQLHSSTTQYAIRNTLPLFVGVFVDAAPETIDQILDFCHLDAAQLHGAEAPEVVTHFQGRAFKALRPQSAAEAAELIQTYQPEGTLAAQSNPLPTFLLDAYHPTLYGGTGHSADWSLVATLARQYPIMLAGSLTPDNVSEAIQAVQPWGVDVSSGVEAQKGKKDHGKMRVFVERAKEVKRKA
jgi:phosphoribosylanthranilate isomerase